MSCYPYRRRRLPRRYVSPYALRRRGGADPRAVAVAAGAVAVLVLMHAHPLTGHAPGRHAAPKTRRNVPASPSRAAREAVAYAESKVTHVPYVWGGTTDAGMDCSGLVMTAWAAAGVSIQRTSQEQWATEQRVSSPRPGDLVFFAGSDGTPTSPGHVGIVVDPARHLMVDAYATGTWVRYDTYGPGESAPGLDPVVGFTDPGGA
jgi:cell wall-associated NlpC family hydrolase